MYERIKQTINTCLGVYKYPFPEIDNITIRKRLSRLDYLT